MWHHGLGRLPKIISAQGSAKTTTAPDTLTGCYADYAFDGDTLEYQGLGHDRYGREPVWMRVGGEDVAALMIAEGLAVAYDGASRIDWCARLAGG